MNTTANWLDRTDIEVSVTTIDNTTFEASYETFRVLRFSGVDIMAAMASKDALDNGVMVDYAMMFYVRLTDNTAALTFRDTIHPDRVITGFASIIG